MIFIDLSQLDDKSYFYGGVNEIGGNKILLEDKDTRVFLDFGKGFSQYPSPYLLVAGLLK
jgi:mRNA degradation ribonuclease J1/J2